MARELMYREALREAIDEEMARDPTVFIIGEGIAERGGSYKVTEGLLAKYGPKRVRDTPIAEAGMIGVGVGAAIAGARPIVEILYVDFAMLGMDMIVNQAAKFRLMTGGEGRVPFGIHLMIGKNYTVFLADTTINERPSAEMLAHIATETAAVARRLGGEAGGDGGIERVSRTARPGC